MKLSDLISSPEHRANMWRRLYFNDPYFNRLWKELEHYNASPNRALPPLTNEEMVTISMLMLAQQKAETLEEAYKRAGAFAFASTQWHSVELDNPPELFKPKTEEDFRREIETIRSLGISSFLRPIVTEGHTFTVIEMPIEEHPMFQKLKAKYGSFAEQAAAVTADALSDMEPPAAVVNNTVLTTIAELGMQPDTLRGELDDRLPCGIALCRHGVPMDKPCGECHMDLQSGQEGNPRQG